MRRPNQYGAYHGGMLAYLAVHHAGNGVCAMLG